MAELLIDEYEQKLTTSQNNEEFWANVAKELYWSKPWNKIVDWQYPFASWFEDGQTNIISNTLDRHLTNGNKDKKALIWIAEDLSERIFTYQQLSEEVSKLANGLIKLGIKKGETVAIYLTRISELKPE